MATVWLNGPDPVSVRTQDRSDLNSFESGPMLTVRSGRRTCLDEFAFFFTNMRLLSSKYVINVQKWRKMTISHGLALVLYFCRKSTLCSTKTTGWREMFHCFASKFLNGPVRTRDRSDPAVGPVFRLFCNWSRSGLLHGQDRTGPVRTV